MLAAKLLLLAPGSANAHVNYQAVRAIHITHNQYSVSWWPAYTFGLQ